MNPHRLALALAALQVISCALTATERAAIVSAESLACTLVPLADPSIPPGIEAQACAMAEDATKALPVSAQAVVAKAKEVGGNAPSQMTHVVAGHGVITDHRVVVGMRVDGGTR